MRAINLERMADHMARRLLPADQHGVAYKWPADSMDLGRRRMR
jgi:hypothetical protein